jgi:predicted nucleic acid-binding protein
VYLVDTNIIIDALKAKRSRLEFLQRLSTHAPLAYCSIVVTELFAGFASATEIKKAQADLLDTIVYVETSQSAAELAGTLQHQYKRRGVALGTADALIAATAITEGHTLVTDNVKHFPMPELNLVKAPAL